MSPVVEQILELLLTLFAFALLALAALVAACAFMLFWLLATELWAAL